MKPTALSEIPLNNYPDLIAAIVDQRARLYFSMVAHSQYSFFEENGQIWPSQTGLYEVVHPTQVASQLQARYRGTDLDGLSLPELKDEQGKRLYIIQSDEDFAPDDEGRQGITLVRFPFDQFLVEWHEPSKKTTEPRGQAGQLVNKYLDEKGSGGLAGLRNWAKEEYGASRVMDSGSWHLKWIDFDGKERLTHEKTLSNLLSKYRKELT